MLSKQDKLLMVLPRLVKKVIGKWCYIKEALLGIKPWPTPIYDCNMTILVPSGINCIEVWWSTDGCNWNGAIAWGNHKMLCCNRFLLMQWPKNPTTTNSWLLKKILQCKKRLVQPILGCNSKYDNEQKRKCNQFLVARLNIATITFVA
jgi:hypothetical protein